MGLDINGIRFLLYARTVGVDFSRSVMIGRQSLLLDPSELKQNLIEFDYSFNDATIQAIFKDDDGYSEELFKCLGANTIESFDNSAYEGATHIHDMNKAIPDNFKERYSVVLDGGSLEHVFNFPVAIKNCMEMVKVGGHYLGITPVNNFMGHGFYQFSPELYFSVFTGDNGFELIDIIAFEDHKKDWYSVKSPLSVKDRITLVNSAPTYLLVIAKRVANSPIFKSSPQQSDYVAIWSQDKLPTDEPASTANREGKLVRFLRSHIPITLRKPIMLLRRRLNSGFSPRFYTAINPTAVVDQTDKTIRRKFVNSRR